MRVIIIKMILMLINIVGSDEVQDLFANCRISDTAGFEECLKFAFNQLNPIFKQGLPEYNVLPFDPHKQSSIELHRGDRGGLGGFKLTLNDVSEYGWTKSWITKLQ